MTAAILPQAACIPIMQLHATTATPVPQAILAQQAFAWGRPFLAATVQTSRSAILPAELMQNAQLRMYVHANMAGLVPHAAQISMNVNLAPAAQTQRASIRKAAIPASALRIITIAMAAWKTVASRMRHAQMRNNHPFSNQLA